VSGAASAYGAAPKSIAVYLLDDHEVVRRGVRDLLEAEPDITVIGEAGTASSALARIEALRPDVAVLDVRLPDGDRGVGVPGDPVPGARGGLPDAHLVRRWRGAVRRDHGRGRGLRAEADPRHRPGRRGAHGGVSQSMLDPRAASQLMARLRDQPARRDPLAGLSAQERRILELIGEGLTNRQIGERMVLAEKTVKNYVSALFAMLGMHHRTQAAALALSSGPPSCRADGSRTLSVEASRRHARYGVPGLVARWRSP
jgi:two-component system, NarL family, response regulator DevR